MIDSLRQPDPIAPELTIRIGLEFVYETQIESPLFLLIKPRLEPAQSITKELLEIQPGLSLQEYADPHGNIVSRVNLPPGRTTIRHDAFVAMPIHPEPPILSGAPVPVKELSPELLRYTLPSRYCDSDRLMDFAYQQFGNGPQGIERVQAICDWVHNHIAYRYGEGCPNRSAWDTIQLGSGVCRDFAHTAVALCRTFNIPARYVTGYVPDVGIRDRGVPMDFHAYFQAYVANSWHTFDARFNVPRLGRINIACGLDAVDGAFATVYGGAQMVLFNVWAYQVDPREVGLGDPIDLSKRLDGTPELRFP